MASFSLMFGNRDKYGYLKNLVDACYVSGRKVKSEWDECYILKSNKFGIQCIVRDGNRWSFSGDNTNTPSVEFLVRKY